jgi:hypothetical protein
VSERDKGVAKAPAKVSLRVVAYIDYEADPAHYGTDDPVQMAAVDTANFADGNLGVFFDGVTVVVMPLEVES